MSAIGWCREHKRQEQMRKAQRHRVVHVGIVFACCTLLSGCAFGMTPRQRSATIQFGRSLSMYGQLLAGETSYIRTQVKEMRVLAVSLPSESSAQRFSQADYATLGEGLNERRLEKLVKLGGSAQKFGGSMAKVADLSSTTAEEKIFSSTSHNFVLVAGSLAEGLTSVRVAAPAVNVVTFLSTDAYRRRLIARTLAETEPTMRNAVVCLEKEFDAKREDSLLAVYLHATDQLDGLLESANSSFTLTRLSPEDRYLVARSYRVVMRNRDHIRYVTSRQRQLAREIGRAYDALLASLNQQHTDLGEINRCSNAVLATDVAFKSLR